MIIIDGIHAYRSFTDEYGKIWIEKRYIGPEPEDTQKYFDINFGFAY